MVGAVVRGDRCSNRCWRRQQIAVASSHDSFYVVPLVGNKLRNCIAMGGNCGGSGGRAYISTPSDQSPGHGLNAGRNSHTGEQRTFGNRNGNYLNSVVACFVQPGSRTAAAADHSASETT